MQQASQPVLQPVAQPPAYHQALLAQQRLEAQQQASQQYDPVRALPLHHSSTVDQFYGSTR